MFFADYTKSTKMYSYDNIENMYRLRKCLRGEARKTVASILIYPQNVSQVILELRFNYPVEYEKVLVIKTFSNVNILLTYP